MLSARGESPFLSKKLTGTPLFTNSKNISKDSWDIEFTKNNLVIALEKAGGMLSIPVINYNIDKSDILKLFEIAGRYAK